MRLTETDLWTDDKEAGMRRWRKRLLVFVLFLSLFVAGALPGTHAAPEGDKPASYSGLDLVVLVDQSGSMRGYTDESGLAHPPNDEPGLRFSGVQTLIKLLANDKWAIFGNQDVDFAISVVYFGSTVEVPLPATIIDVKTEAQAEQLAEELSRQVSQEKFGERDLGDTHVALALREAKNQFDRMAEIHPGQKRLKALILFTDGLPHVNEPGFSVYDYFNKEIIPFFRGNFPYPEYYFAVVALNDSTQAYWTRVGYLWKDLSRGKAELVNDNTQCGAYLQGHLWALMTTLEPGLKDNYIEIPQTEDTVAVDPYVRRMIIVIHKPSPDARVEVDVPCRDKRVDGERQYIETITLYEPTPGIWPLKRPVTALPPKVFVEYVRAYSTSPNPAGMVPAYFATPIECQVFGEGGKPVDGYPDPKYALTVTARVESGSDVWDLPLKQVEAGKYTAMFLPPREGKYAVYLTGRSHGPKGNEITVFDRELEPAGKFVVASVSPALVAPGTTYTLLVPAKIRISLVDAGGAIVRAPSGSQAPDMEAKIVGPAGSSKTASLAMQADGTYLLEFTPASEGLYWISITARGSDPTTGKPVTFFEDKAIGSIEVKAPTLAWTGFEGVQSQHVPIKVSFKLQDMEGRPLSETLQKGYTLRPEAVLSSGGQKWSVALQESPTKEWEGTFTPTVPGQYDLRIKVSAVDGSGNVTVLLEASRPTFPVEPTTLVRYEIITPKSGSRIERRDVLARPRPFVVEIELRDERGALVDPASVLSRPQVDVFAVRVTDGLGRDRSNELRLSPTEKPGVFRASCTTLQELGVYTVEVRPIAQLRPAHVYDQPSRVVRVEVVENRILAVVIPLLLPLGIVLGIALLAFIGWQVYLRLWLAQGVLQIETERGEVVQTFTLSTYGKHTIVVSKGDLRAGTHLKRLSVRQPRGQEYVLVTGVLVTGLKVLSDFMMVDGSRIPYDMGLYLVYSRGGTSRWEHY